VLPADRPRAKIVLMQGGAQGGEGKGGGARDVVIWLTTLNAAGAYDGEVLFLPQDGDFGSAAGWHPDFAAEISGASLRLLRDGISQPGTAGPSPARSPGKRPGSRPGRSSAR
jgi:hypothetical protein